MSSTLPAASSIPTFAPAPEQEVKRVVKSLASSFGGKFADLFRTVKGEELRGEWALALAGFHPVEIERGLHRARHATFPPTSGEFAKMCRPALEPEFAFLEAGEGLRERDAGRMGEWTHPAVYRAACRMGMEVRSGDFKAVRKRWEWTLQRELDRGWGEPIDQPALRIESDPKVGPPSLEVSQQIALILRTKDVAAKLRKRAGRTEVDPVVAARSERLAAIDWKTSTPEQRVAEFGEAFRTVEIVEVVPGSPIAITVNLSGRRRMLCADDLQAALSEAIAAIAAAASKPE